MPVRRFLVLFLLAGVATALVLKGLEALITLRPVSMKYEIEQKLAANIASGHYAMPPQTFNERALRWQTVADLKHSPDMVVIGSSHGLRVDGAMLNEPDLQNLSVTGGMMPDGWITTDLIARARLRPRIWVIFVEPWFFDIHADIGLWQQRGDDAVAFERQLATMTKPELPPVYGPRLKKKVLPSLFTPLTLSPVIDWFEKEIRSYRFDPNPPADGELHGLALRGDGSFFLTWEVSEPETGSTRLALRQFAMDADRYRYGNYPVEDPVLWAYFTRWLLFCRAHGSEVWLILPPFHPAIYGKIVATPHNQLGTIEERTRALAAREGMKLIGSYNPAALGLGAGDFEDGDHLNDRGLTRLLAHAALTQTEPAAIRQGAAR